MQYIYVCHTAETASYSYCCSKGGFKNLEILRENAGQKTCTILFTEFLLESRTPPSQTHPSPPDLVFMFFNITECFCRVICICQDSGFGVMNCKVDTLEYIGIEKPNPESKAEEQRCSVLHYLFSLPLLFSPLPCLSIHFSFCSCCRAEFFHFMIKPLQICYRDRSACIIYNHTFSRMVMNSFLPLIVLNLECDYYIEKTTLFVAIPTSTNYTLLIVCVFSVYLSQKVKCQMARLHGYCPSSDN